VKPAAPELAELEDVHGSGAYLKRDVQVMRGEGARLLDAAGRGYIDCVSGMGAANLGHGHPRIVEAIRSQAQQLVSCPELFRNPVRARYQAELCRATGMPRVFLANSGSEAVEAALKVARLVTGRKRLIGMMRGFHGRTLGALSLTWEKSYRDPFEPLLAGIEHVPFNRPERLAAVLDETVAAVLVEVVQGEGGVRPAEPGFLQDVAALCRGVGALLVVDEVQTGFGRTGSLFAHQAEGLRPDLLCLAKSMAGGLPMGAVLLGERVGALPPRSHGSTFGGNPVACAAASAVLEVLGDGVLVERCARLGEQAIARLRERLPDSAVREVRGRGFLIGVELRERVAPVLARLQELGVVALNAGPTVLRLLPPLVISEDELGQVLDAVVQAVGDGH
jgi:LysW-gamma-L-lysine/LysW-L-ornithine aminotransferase